VHLTDSCDRAMTIRAAKNPSESVLSAPVIA
jgi:hypothetical protein